MMDDDALDRALASLPLEEPSPALHARILTATIYRPRPMVAMWEVWLIATLAAVAVWLSWAVVSAPSASTRLADLVTDVVNAGGLNSVQTLLWLGTGISAAWWLSVFTTAPRRRIQP